jgi:hypothetical protein
MEYGYFFEVKTNAGCGKSPFSGCNDTMEYGYFFEVKTNARWKAFIY